MTQLFFREGFFLVGRVFRRRTRLPCPLATMTKSARSHVNGGDFRRSDFLDSESTLFDSVRRSATRRSHSTLTGSFPVFSVSV